MVNMLLPSNEEAEKLLDWAYELNPGVWVNHCKVVARAAETIANKCGLDKHRAYVSGLLHDIGRYEGVTELRHVYAGYELLKCHRYHQIADVCLSHSFPLKIIGEYFGKNDCSADEYGFIKTYLSDADYNEYDKLIQLCDSIGSAAGVCLLEVRIMDVIRRHGFTEFMQNKIEAYFKIKSHFDELCGMNIYDLFYDEIRNISFR